MKKALTILVALTLALALTVCGGNSTSSSSIAGNATSSKTRGGSMD